MVEVNQQKSFQSAEISNYQNSQRKLRGSNRSKYNRVSGNSPSLSQSAVSLISNRGSPINELDLVTLLNDSTQLTTRQKQLLIAIQQSDSQYLIDMDIMDQENATQYDFTFSNYNITPVMLACAIGESNIVRIIMQSPMRESINNNDSQGFNCLYYAVYHGHIEVVTLLKKLEVVYQKDAKGTSCLHVAVMRGHLHIAEFLLKKTPRNLGDDILRQPTRHQSNISTKNKESQEKRQQQLVRQTNKAYIWEAQIDVDEQRLHDEKEEGISAVFFAIRAESLRCLKLLVDFGADFNMECMSESKQKMRPIQYAVYRGKFPIYKFILERNSDNIESQIQCQLLQTGSTLLHLNAFKGDVDILKDLISKNLLNPFAQNKQGDTCVHVAIRRQHVNFLYEVISWCVAKNITAAQAEVENTVEHLTPFMTAVLRDQFDIANLLLKNNLATRTYKNIDGRDVHQIAEDSNRERALAYLENREIPRQVYNRKGSVDHIINTKPINTRNSSPQGLEIAAANFDRRKGSVETLPRKDDIFGKSFLNEKQHQSIHKPIIKQEVQLDMDGEEKKQTRIKGSTVNARTPLKQRNLPSFEKSSDFGLQTPIRKGMNHNEAMGGQSDVNLSLHQSQRSDLRSLASPLKIAGRTPKMPRLDLDQTADDDIEKVSVKDFIKKNTQRR